MSSKMINILKKSGLWWKEGDVVVMDSHSDDTRLGVIDLVHSDDMLSIKFNDGKYELLFHEQIRKALKMEKESNKRIWREAPLMDYSSGTWGFDD